MTTKKAHRKNSSSSAPANPRAPRQKRPFSESQISGQRAFETAQMRGDWAQCSIQDFEAAYQETSRRPKAKLENPAFLKAQYEKLTGKKLVEAEEETPEPESPADWPDTRLSVETPNY